jgi:predicted nucleic acid-binding protein
MIIADTDVWIDFIKKPRSSAAQTLGDLLTDDRLAMVGIVLTEVLRGVRDTRGRFLDLADAIPFLEMSKQTWIESARIASRLDRAGSPIPITDACVAAVAMENDCELFTRDKHFRRIPGLRLYDPDKEPTSA